MSGAGLYYIVRRVLQLQMLIILIVSGLTLLLAGAREAGSAIAGGLVGFVPNAYFAIKFGRQDPRKTASQVVRAFYLGETIKLVVTALLFAIVFQIPGIEFMPLFIGFVPVVMVFWFALLLHN